MHCIKNINVSIPLIRPRTSKVKARSEGQPGLSTVVVRGILSSTLSFSLPNTEFENRNYYQKLTESINTIYSHLLQNTSVSSSFAVLLIFTEKLKRRRRKKTWLLVAGLRRGNGGGFGGASDRSVGKGNDLG